MTSIIPFINGLTLVSPAILFGTHSPNSTSSQTYKMMISKSSGATTSVSTYSQRYSIILREIRA